MLLLSLGHPASPSIAMMGPILLDVIMIMALLSMDYY